ncbi:hypothetical protein B566_EDAN012342 [Ephemera danica]|nr:hypothetical protein B566_EDAN012342 [Ephemera danica]
MMPTLLGNRTYFFSNNQKTTWLDALQFCRVFGMDLASVETSEENTLLQDHLASLRIKDHYVSISGHKIGRANYIWANGAAVDNTIGWAHGEPAQFSTENCMIMWRGFWYDLPCEAYTGYFICEQIP